MMTKTGVCDGDGEQPEEKKAGDAKPKCPDCKCAPDDLPSTGDDLMSKMAEAARDQIKK